MHVMEDNFSCWLLYSWHSGIFLILSKYIPFGHTSAHALLDYTLTDMMVLL